MTQHYCESCDTTTDHDTIGDYRECQDCGSQLATCDDCGRDRADVDELQVAHATMASPAEYARLCRDCRPGVRLTGQARLQALADAGIDTRAAYAERV